MPKAQQSSRVFDLCVCGLTIALITVSSWVTVPLGPVPFTLQILVLVFALLALTPKQAAISIVGYVLLGAIGVPVFSGMRGGIGVIMGTTGGFLLAYALGAVLLGLMLHYWKEPQRTALKWVREIVTGVLYLALIYLMGWAQLMVVANLDPFAAFAAGVAPFIVLDAIKIAVGVSLAHTLKAAVPALRRQQA